MNQPLIFVKPHVVNNELVRSVVDQAFHERGIVWLEDGRISGHAIAKGGLIDKHYSVIAHAGTIRDAAELEIGEKGRGLFQSTFGEQWDTAVVSGRVKSGLVLQEELGWTARAVNELWIRDLPMVRVAGGHYVAYSAEHDCFLVNGFYPLVRETYTSDDAAVLYGVMQFDSLALPWKVFRHEVIGATNPARAAERSIRGYLYSHQDELGAHVSNSDNVIHASASPFEALIEKKLWVKDFDEKTDTFFQLLSKKGFTFERIHQAYLENPMLSLRGGEPGALIDLIEDCDTAEAATRFCELLA